MARAVDKKYVDPSELYNYLVEEKGVSRNHALGIIANVKAESGFNVSAIGDKGTSIGLFQHHGPRAEKLKKFAGGNWTDWKKQVDYMLQENDTKKYLSKNFESPVEASEDFTINWERPSNKQEKAKKRSTAVSYFENRLGNSVESIEAPSLENENYRNTLPESNTQDEEEEDDTFVSEAEQALEQDEEENTLDEETADDTELQEAKQIIANKQAMLEEMQQKMLEASQGQEEEGVEEEGFAIDQIEILPQNEYGNTPNLFRAELPKKIDIINQSTPMQQEPVEQEVEEEPTEAMFGGQFKGGGTSEPPPLLDNIVYPQGDSEYRMRPYNMDIIDSIYKQRRIQQGIDQDNYINPDLDRHYFRQAVRTGKLGDNSEANITRQPIKIVI